VGALTLERWDLPKLAEILVGNGRRFRVLHVVPFDEEDESPFVGLLRVETADARATPNVGTSLA
jgi:hypothetical protein